jgi:hypothetical protein
MCDLNPSYIQNVKWNYFKEIDYKPHKGGQRDYHLSEARFRIIAAGTRWGKSMGAGNEYAGFMMVAPFPFRFWIVAPSYDLGAKEFEYVWAGLIETLKVPTKKQNWNVRSGNMVIETEWGSWIRVRSAKDEDLLYGEELDGIIMSEASKIPGRIYQRVIRGRLTSRLGRLDIPTTPKGKNNWVHELWKMGQDENEKDYWSCLYPSSANPYLDEGELNEAKKTLNPRIYAEQYGGEFITLSGNVFTFSEANIVDEFPEGGEIPPNYGQIYRVVDFGFRNPLCCLWIWVQPLPDGNERHWVFKEHYARETLMHEHVKIIQEQSALFEDRVECTYYDPHGMGSQAAAEMASHGIDGLIPVEKGEEVVMADRVNYMLNKVIGDLPLLVFMRWCQAAIEEHRDAEWEENTMRVERNEREMIKKYKNHSVDCSLYFENMRSYVTPALSIEGEKRHTVIPQKPDLMKQYYGLIIRDDEGAKDILVDTDDPAGLDALLQPYGGRVVGFGMPEGCRIMDNFYVIRVNTDEETLKMIRNAIGEKGVIKEVLKGVLA